MIDAETSAAPDPAGGADNCGQSLLMDDGTGLALAVVEPSDLVRDLLCQHVGACLPAARVIACAEAGELAQHAVTDAPRRCIVLGADGDADAMRKSVRTAAQAWPNAVIALAPAACEANVVAAAMGAGAHGVIPKSYSRQSFTAALAVILSGEPFVPWTMQARRTTLQDNGVVLTERERHVLGYLGEGMANREIARLLQIREVTVKLHMRSLFKKLGVNNRTKAVRQAIRIGILD